VTDPATMTAGSAWFGHPPFALPRRVPTDIDRRLTHKPSFVRRFNRVVWELARFAVPAPPIFVALWAAGWIAAIVASDHGLLEESLRIAGVVFAVAALGVLSVLALKWLLLGRVRPGQHALWSCWCSRWDFHYVLWERYARSILISLEGTALIAWYLRAMGARIGRRVVLSEGFAQVVDPDMLEFEDDVTVHALFQAHSFEDRMLKIDRIVVGRRADVGQGAVLFFGARIGEGAKVLPHSVVMKREQVLPSRVYVGCPVRAE
jgi:non-ribosomal peptide synthetase-like protein